MNRLNQKIEKEYIRLNELFPIYRNYLKVNGYQGKASIDNPKMHIEHVLKQMIDLIYSRSKIVLPQNISQDYRVAMLRSKHDQFIRKTLPDIIDILSMSLQNSKNKVYYERIQKSLLRYIEGSSVRSLRASQLLSLFNLMQQTKIYSPTICVQLIPSLLTIIDDDFHTLLSKGEDFLRAKIK